MGRASKNRGPIGLNTGRLQETARSAGERKAPCSLAPWQLPPKVSTPGDVPTYRAHQQDDTSPRTAVAIHERLQETAKPIRGTRPAHHPNDPAPLLIGRGDRPQSGQLEARAEERPVQPVSDFPSLTPPLHIVVACHPQTGVHTVDAQTISQPILTRASHRVHLNPS